MSRFLLVGGVVAVSGILPSTAVDFRTELLAEVDALGASLVLADGADLTARRLSADVVSTTNANKRTTFKSSVNAKDVAVEAKLEGSILRVDTLIVDEIISTGNLSIDGLFQLNDGIDSSQTSFVQVEEDDNPAQSPHRMVLLYDSDEAGVAQPTSSQRTGWTVAPSRHSITIPESSFASITSDKVSVLTQSCGHLKDILGGPCHARNIEYRQTFFGSTSDDNEDRPTSLNNFQHDEVCLDFSAHFFDMWPNAKGIDAVYASIDGQVVWLDSHTSPSPNSRAYAISPDVCGNPDHPDTKLGQKISVCAPHSGSSVSVAIGGAMKDPDDDRVFSACEQSWGVSNVRVVARSRS